MTFMEEQERQPFETVWSIVEREYLKPRGIEPADYHGGKMIGPACKAYMQNSEEIYNEIEDYMMQRVENHKMDPEHAQQVCFRLCIYKACLQNFDGLFSVLRSRSTTFGSVEQRVNKVKKFLDAALKCWRRLKMTITPKLHLLEDHITDFVRDLDRIEDYHEEFVEQIHQTDLKLDKLVKIRDTNKRFVAKSELEHARTGHLLDDVISKCQREQKRKFSDQTVKETASQRHKIYKEEIRSSGLKTATDKLDDTDDLLRTDELNMAIARGII